MKPMKVAILCEFSGVVRDAFIRRGHDAVSCDLLPSDRPGPHIQGDCFAQDWSDFDLAICHPPCTYLCNSGVRWLYNADGSLNEERWQNMAEGKAFFQRMLDLPTIAVAVENPIMHKHARAGIRPYDQIIQPWQFGVGETKSTCLWLRELPCLTPTKLMAERKPKVHWASPGPDRWKIRSATPEGVADAMADQWGGCAHDPFFRRSGDCRLCIGIPLTERV